MSKEMSKEFSDAIKFVKYTSKPTILTGLSMFVTTPLFNKYIVDNKKRALISFASAGVLLLSTPMWNKKNQYIPIALSVGPMFNGITSLKPNKTGRILGLLSTLILFGASIGKYQEEN